MAVDGVQNDPNQPKGVKKEVVVKQDQKLSNIFDVYDDNKNKILDKDDLQVLNSVFTNGGQKTKVTKDDLDEITKELNKNLADDQKVTTKDVENFYKNVVTAEKQGLKNGETPIVQEVEIEESSEASAQNNPQSGATQSGTKPDGQGEDEPELHPYTVQMDESFTGIIKRSLKAQGIDNPTAEQIQEAKDKFKENNEGVVKTAKNGVEYILVGAKVNLEGELEDKANAAEQQKAWADKYSKGRKAKAGGKEESKPVDGETPPDKETAPKGKETTPKGKETTPPVQHTPDGGKTKTEPYGDGTKESTWDANGNQTKCIIKDKNGKVIKSTEWTHDEKGQTTKIKESTFNAFGKEAKRIIWGADKKISSKTEWSYDNKGNKTGTTETTYTKGKISKRMTWNAKGKVTKIETFDAKGKIINNQEYFYDDKGNRIKKNNIPSGYTGT